MFDIASSVAYDFFLKILHYSTNLSNTAVHIQVSRKWRTSDALRCRRDYNKREKNVKKILLDLFADLAVFENGT
jgi:hypothetical protein